MSKMLEDQHLIVKAAHKARIEALKIYGALSPQYKAATKVYEEELRRYNFLEFEVSTQRSCEEIQQMGRAIGRYFSELDAEVEREYESLMSGFMEGQKIIDITPEKSESGDTLSKGEYESLKKEQDYPEIVSEKRPMLPKPKK